MRLITPEQINVRSHYKVRELRDNTFFLITDSDLYYTIGFSEDDAIGLFGCYHFFITCHNEQRLGSDEKLQETIFVILEEFFANPEVSVVYLCDMRDNRQAVRSRLFAIWFNANENRENYSLLQNKIEFENELYYLGMLLRNDNPEYAHVVETFATFVTNMPRAMAEKMGL